MPDGTMPYTPALSLHLDELPHSIEAEQALLGAVLQERRAFNAAAEHLRPEHFANVLHGLIWETCAALEAQGKRATPISLRPLLEAEPTLRDAGGTAYLAQLAAACLMPGQAADYARQIVDMHQRREIIRAAASMIEDARHPTYDRPARAVAEAGAAALDPVLVENSRRSMRHLTDCLDDAIADWQEAAKNGGPTGVMTGLGDLDRLLRGMKPGRLYFVGGRPAMGKAQPLDAMVRTASGWKRMGDLRLGDQLASVDGAPSLVSGIFPQGERKVYRVTFSDGRSTRCCGEHLWQVDSSRWKGGPKVKTTDELRALLQRKRYHRRITVPLVSGDFGSGEPLPLDPWLVGALIGNGCLSRETPSVSTADAATLFRVQQAIEGMAVAVSANGSGYDYRLSGAGGPNAVTAALRQVGLYGKLSHEKFIPAAYMMASRADRMELLKGLMDTDGWVETFGAVRFSTSSARLADDVQELVRSLGGLCSVSSKRPTYTHKGERREGREHFVCNIRLRDPSQAFSLTRKKRRCVRRTPVALTIVAIEEDGTEPVQCISVTHPSRLYVTDDYVVTHNTAWMLTTALNAAKAGKTVGLWSLEMKGGDLAQRVLAAECGFDTADADMGRLPPEAFQWMMEAKAKYADLGVHIDDSEYLTPAGLRSRAMQMRRRHGLDLVMVDYLGLMDGDDRRENKVQEVSQITRSLKRLAHEVEAPVVVLSQLNRGVEQRDDKRPMLSDLRDSGSIEQDADAVMFLYREQYYLEKAEPQRKPEESQEKWDTRHGAWMQRLEEVHNTAEIIVAKQRRGPTGTARVYFDGPRTRFENLQQGGW